MDPKGLAAEAPGRAGRALRQARGVAVAAHGAREASAESPVPETGRATWGLGQKLSEKVLCKGVDELPIWLLSSLKEEPLAG